MSSVHGQDPRCVVTEFTGWLEGAEVRRERVERLGDGEFPSMVHRIGRDFNLAVLERFEQARDVIVRAREVSSVFRSGEAGRGTLRAWFEGTEVLESVDVALDKRPRVRQNLDNLTLTYELPLYSPDPYLYGEVQSRRIVTAGAGRGLVWPLFRNKAGAQVGRLDWGAPDESDISPLANTGNATAYPVVRVSGNFPAGFELSLTAGDWHRIVFNADVRGREIVVDFSGSVTVDGVDMSWALSERGWAGVEPGQQATAAIRSLSAEGSGVAHVELRPTYL